MAYQQAHWNQELMWPWQALARTISSIWNHPSSPVRTNFYEIRLLAMFGGTLVLGFASRRVRLSWVVYAWGCLILFLSAREAISIARYLWVLFPIFIQLGFWTRRPLIFQMMQIVSGLGFGLWFVLYGLGKGAF